MSITAPAPDYKLYNRLYSVLLTVLTSPFMAGFIIAVNYYRLNDKLNCKRAVFLSFLYMIIEYYVFSLNENELDSFIVNVTTFVIGSPITALFVYFLHTVLQNNQLKNHGDLGGQFESLWILIPHFIGHLFIGIFVAVVVATASMNNLL
ncbi:hypothetical protein LRN22_004284 [Salmonella enterica]|nr:hypothetical protein [Salmonella enterica]EME7695733.1 hypothetical protein [Salmonella enterica]